MLSGLYPSLVNTPKPVGVELPSAIEPLLAIPVILFWHQSIVVNNLIKLSPVGGPSGATGYSQVR